MKLEPLDFAEWIGAHSVEYGRMVQHMLAYSLTCDQVIELMKASYESGVAEQ